MKQTTGLVNQPWVQELLGREMFTSTEAGDLIGRYGPDALTRLRNDKGLRLIVVGQLAETRGRPKLYRLERVEEEACR